MYADDVVKQRPAISMEDLFFRRLSCSPAVYFAAPDELQECKILPHGELSIESLCPGQFIRLEGYKVEAMRQGLLREDGTWQTNCAIVDLSQSENVRQRINVLATPALLQRSQLFDMKTNKFLSTADLWLVQGFPRPMPAVPPSISSKFPFTCIDLVDEAPSAHVLRRNVQRSLCGNSMHTAAVSQWTLYNIL